ncbi:hypothetical protein Hanom_Chr00s000005g01611871 [Helianthus anomalus]
MEEPKEAGPPEKEAGPPENEARPPEKEVAAVADVFDVAGHFCRYFRARIVDLCCCLADNK